MPTVNCSSSFCSHGDLLQPRRNYILHNSVTKVSERYIIMQLTFVLSHFSQ